MQSGIENNIIIIKLENNEDVFESLTYAVKEFNIRSGLILSGIGMLKEFELGYYSTAGYITRFFKIPHELISLKGSIAFGIEDDNQEKLLLHIHCALADDKQQVWGGHLHKAKVNVINEITLLRLENVQLTRIKNNTTGLMELNIGSNIEDN